MGAFVRAMGVVERVIRYVETIFAAIVVVLMMTVMVVVVADVAMRYAFNNPLAWAYDLIGLYLMAAIFFLALSFTYAANGHVSVDILMQGLPPTARRVSEIIGCVGGIVVFVLLGYVGATRAYVSWANNEAISGLIQWPTWIGALFVPVGSAALVLRLAYRLAGNVASLITGQNVVPILAMSGDEIASEKERV